MHVTAARDQAAEKAQHGPDTKTLHGAFHRAIAVTRGHRDAMFKSDGDVIERYLQHGRSNLVETESAS